MAPILASSESCALEEVRRASCVVCALRLAGRPPAVASRLGSAISSRTLSCALRSSSMAARMSFTGPWMSSGRIFCSAARAAVVLSMATSWASRL